MEGSGLPVSSCHSPEFDLSVEQLVTELTGGA
jgi:hypothetical protein